MTQWWKAPQLLLSLLLLAGPPAFAPQSAAACNPLLPLTLLPAGDEDDDPTSAPARAPAPSRAHGPRRARRPRPGAARPPAPPARPPPRAPPPRPPLPAARPRPLPGGPQPASTLLASSAYAPPSRLLAGAAGA